LRKAPRVTHAQPTLVQLSANQLSRIARFLKLDSADTFKLTGNTSLAGQAEQTALQVSRGCIEGRVQRARNGRRY
jgi:hypothetical protein